MRLTGEVKSKLTYLKEQLRLKQLAAKVGEPTGSYDYHLLCAIDEANRSMKKLEALKKRYIWNEPPV
jgi:hypothetical protein